MPADSGRTPRAQPADTGWSRRRPQPMPNRQSGYLFFFLAAAFFGAGAGAFATAGCAATGLSVFLVANFIQTPFLTFCFSEAAFLVATAFFAGAAFFRDTAVILAAACFGTAAFFTGASS